MQKSLPPLSAAISGSSKEESWIASSAIDLVSSLAQGAQENRLGAGFFELLGPSLFGCLADVEDRDVTQVSGNFQLVIFERN